MLFHNAFSLLKTKTEWKKSLFSIAQKQTISEYFVFLFLFQLFFSLSFSVFNSSWMFCVHDVFAPFFSTCIYDSHHIIFCNESSQIVFQLQSQKRIAVGVPLSLRRKMARTVLRFKAMAFIINESTRLVLLLLFVCVFLYFLKKFFSLSVSSFFVLMLIVCHLMHKRIS